MVQRVWGEIPVNYPGTETNVFVIMPDHFQADYGSGIILIVSFLARWN